MRGIGAYHNFSPDFALREPAVCRINPADFTGFNLCSLKIAKVAQSSWISVQNLRSKASFAVYAECQFGIVLKRVNIHRDVRSAFAFYSDRKLIAY